MATNIHFDILDKGAIFNILRVLSAKDVLSLSSVTKQLNRILHDKYIAIRLMNIHYPYDILTNNPVSQYIAIATGVKTYYKIPKSSLSEKKKSYIYNPIYSSTPFKETSNYITFRIDGNLIPERTKIWMTYSTRTDFKDNIFLSKNREQSILRFVENYYSVYLEELIESFYDWAPEDHDRLSDDNEYANFDLFNLFLDKNTRPSWGKAQVRAELIPFTRENMYNYCMTHNRFRLYENADYDDWFFVKRIF